jgi:Arc/MetJ family transcription regulator
MRTTLNLNDELLLKAQQYTGITEKTKLLHLGLEALLKNQAAQNLIALGGTDKQARAGRRQRQ